MTEPRLAPILARIGTLHPKLIDLDLTRMARLLDDLGRPQHRLPPVIHIAGTNGKGSLAAYLRAIADAAGLKPHVYTSPHLVRYTERYVLAGREIEEAHLESLLARVEEVNAGRPLTVFELLTAAGFLAFAETRADLLILEVGMGGRLDATNMVERPALSAITPISYDHQQFLGETLAEIAFEKAGILKPGVAAVIGPQVEEAARVIGDRAAEIGASLARHAIEWRYERQGDGGFAFVDEAGQHAFPAPALAGPHQIANAATAVACASALADRFPFDARAIALGLQAARWPARLQRLSRGPLVSMLPDGVTLWLDGGHNPGAAAILADALPGLGTGPCDLVLGMLATKDAGAFLSRIAPAIRRVATVPIPGEHVCVDPGHLADLAAACGLEARAYADLRAALAALSAASQPNRILIAGSLYLAGTVLAENG